MPRYCSRQILPLLLTLALVPRWASASDTDLEQWQEARTRNELFTRPMKPLNVHRVSDAMELRVANNFLVLRTPLTNITAEQSMRATFVGVGGTAIISLSQKIDPAGAPLAPDADGLIEPERFSMSLTDFPAPKLTVSIGIQLDSQSHQLNLSKTIQTTGGPSQSIFFHEDLYEHNQVELQINDQQSQMAAPQVLTLTGSSFSSFVLNHPEQTEKYLRPLFRDIASESVFAPDRMAAYQVFNELWTANPIVAAQVQALLPMLGSVDFHQRDAATARLVEIGRDAAAVLVHLNRARLSAEQNARIDRIIAPYLTLSAKEANRLRSDPYFLLDCLYSDDAPIRGAAVGHLRQVLRPDLQFDINADADTRSSEITSLRIRLLSGMR